MKITLELIEHMAKLARLSFTEEELLAFTTQMQELIDYFQSLADLSTEEIPPTASVLPLKNVMRADEPGQALERKDVLRNAPLEEGGFFKIPTILEEES